MSLTRTLALLAAVSAVPWLPATGPSAAPDGASSAPVSHAVVADAHVSRLRSHANFGGRPVLAVDASPATRAYLRFELPAGPIDRAVLRLHVVAGSGAGLNVASTGLRPWAERSITFASAPRVGTIVASSGPLRRGWVELDLTSLTDGPRTNTVVLTTRGNKRIRVSSRERGLLAPIVLTEQPMPAPPTSPDASPPPSPEPAPPSPNPPPSPEPSCQGVPVGPGSSIQAAVDAHPAGTTFCLAAGVHRLAAPVVPRPGQTFIGDPGATVNGARVVSAWTSSGPYWYATGQTQGPTIQCMSGKACADVTYQESIYADDVFLEDTLLTRVLSRSALEPQPGDPAWMTPHRFYFDYEADTIWLNVDPTGHRVEAAVAAGLFRGAGSIDDVTVRGLVLERAAGFGVSSEGGTGWAITDNEIRLNHTKGIRVWGGARILRNHAHHNGQYGVAASDGPGIVVDGNEIDHNNAARYRVASGYWDAGGTKFVRTSGLIIRGNDVHHNHGDGLWVDIDNEDVTIEGNRVSDNERFGIFYEISHAGLIAANTFTGNDHDAIRITSSDGVEVVANEVVTAAGDPAAGGIRLVQDGRETSGHVVRDVHVHDNRLTMCTGLTGASRSYGGDAMFASRNNRFEGNAYRVNGTAAAWWLWMNGTRTWPQWRSYDQDLSGSIEAASC